MILLQILYCYFILLSIEHLKFNTISFNIHLKYSFRNDIREKFNNRIHLQIINRYMHLNANNNNNIINDNQISNDDDSSRSSPPKKERKWELAYEDDDPRLYRIKGHKNIPQMPKGMNPYMSTKEKKMYDEMMAAENATNKTKSDLEILKDSLRKIGERMDSDFKSPTDRDPLE